MTTNAVSRILIVDDNPDDIFLAKRELKQAGVLWDIREADSKESFLRELEEYPPDMILCDYKMPAFGAPEVLKITKSLPRVVPVIIISGKIGEEKAVELLKAGAVDFLVKEKLERLGVAVRAALEKVRSEGENRDRDEAFRESEKRFRRAMLSALEDQKRAREKIASSAEEWRRTFDSISDMVFLLDKEHTLIRANKAVFDAFGVGPAEILGKKCYEWMHRTGHAWPGCPFEELLKDKKVHSGEALGPKGETLWVTVSPILDAQGELRGAVHIATDITERKRIEAEVLESRDYLRSIIDSVADPIFVKDEGFHWILFNDAFCKFMGRSSQEILGKTDYDFFPKAEADVFREKDKSVFGSGLANINEEMFTDAKGVSHVIVTKKAIYTDLLGKKMLVGVIRDITELKKIEAALLGERGHLEEKVRDRTLELQQTNQRLKLTAEDLRRVSRAKTEFLAKMSHELRTPLNSILGFSEVLFDGTFGALNERQKKYADNILSSGKHLLALINEILDLSKVESGKMELEMSLIPVQGCLEEALGLAEGLFLAKKIQPSIELDEATGSIRADPRKIRQVVFNLLANAVKFTPEGGKVGIRARKTDGEVEIAVWDTGVGIDPKNLESVFTAFSRVESAYTKETEGAGLGLTISRRFVELHGGKIWIESEGVGKGTTVKFTLPANRTS